MYFSFLTWDKYPFLRYTIFLISGILIGESIEIDISNTLICIFFCVIILIYLLSKSHKLIGYIAFILIVSLGVFLSNSNKFKEENIQNHIGFIGKIIDNIDFNSNKYKTIISIDQLISPDNKVIKCNKIKAIIYLSVNKPDFIKYGDIIYIPSTLIKIKRPDNPGEYDHKTYWNRKNIQFEAFSKQVTILKKGSKFNIFWIAEASRKYCDEVFKNHIKGKNEYAIVTAMLLGIRSQLDINIKTAYSNAGIIHVIAISGLHISLFFFLINSLTSKIIKSKKIVAIIILLFIWYYGIMAGLSASVVRAVVMHTVILIGTILNRKTNILNNICFSAFLLLLINHNYIYDLGFQLSYLALLGIILFDLLFPTQFKINNYIGNQIWEICKITLVAQLATFPILLLYFHKFSFSFLIANLLVIPLSTIIIWESILLLFVSFFNEYLCLKLGIIINYCTQFMNDIASILGNFDLLNMSEISFTNIECLILYFGIITFVCYFKYHRKHLLWTFAISFILLIVVRTTAIVIKKDQSILISYSIKNNTYITVIQGFNCNHYFNKQLNYYENNNIKNLLTCKNIIKNDFLNLKTGFKNNLAISNKNYCIINYNSKKLLLIKSKNVPIFNKEIEYLQIANNVKFNWDLITQYYSKSIIIIDKSNHFQYALKLENYLKQRHIKVHNMYSKGAFIQE